MNPSSKKSLLIIYLGNGKGKTTAALGLAARMLGHGKRVCICQFLKAQKGTGEELFFSGSANTEIYLLGQGFVMPDISDSSRKKHCDAAQRGVSLLEEKLMSGNYDLIIADEILDAVDLKFIDEDVICTLASKRLPQTSLVLTGRAASQRLIDAADTVTEMQEIKHHYQQGITVLEGIEY